LATASKIAYLESSPALVSRYEIEIVEQRRIALLATDILIEKNIT